VLDTGKWLGHGGQALRPCIELTDECAPSAGSHENHRPDFLRPMKGAAQRVPCNRNKVRCRKSCRFWWRMSVLWVNSLTLGVHREQLISGVPVTCPLTGAQDSSVKTETIGQDWPEVANGACGRLTRPQKGAYGRMTRSSIQSARAHGRRPLHPR